VTTSHDRSPEAASKSEYYSHKFTQAESGFAQCFKLAAVNVPRLDSAGSFFNPLPSFRIKQPVIPSRMKTKFLARSWFYFLTLLAAPSLWAAEDGAPATWHAQSLGQAIANMIIFATIGLAVAVVGFKVFDKCTPGNLTKEIIENKNIAAAIVGGAVIIGVCIIIAASMLG